jgi:uncharacterized membrane protein YsdA (DUF1294 family)
MSMSRRQNRSANRRGASGRDPYILYGLVTFVPALVLAVVLYIAVDPLDAVMAWLLAITAVTFLAYGYDKAVAGTGRTRVPERVLLVLALAGGTPGAVAGMLMFHHKTAKGRFQLKFLLVVGVQAGLLALYYTVIKPQFGS